MYTYSASQMHGITIYTVLTQPEPHLGSKKTNIR